MKQKKIYIYHTFAVLFPCLAHNQYAAHKANAAAQTTVSHADFALVDWAIRQETMSSEQEILAKKRLTTMLVAEDLLRQNNRSLVRNLPVLDRSFMPASLQEQLGISTSFSFEIEGQPDTSGPAVTIDHFDLHAAIVSRKFLGTVAVPRHQQGYIPLEVRLLTAKSEEARDKIMNDYFAATIADFRSKLVTKEASPDRITLGSTTPRTKRTLAVDKTPRERKVFQPQAESVTAHTASSMPSAQFYDDDEDRALELEELRIRGSHISIDIIMLLREKDRLLKNFNNTHILNQCYTRLSSRNTNDKQSLHEQLQAQEKLLRTVEPNYQDFYSQSQSSSRRCSDRDGFLMRGSSFDAGFLQPSLSRIDTVLSNRTQELREIQQQIIRFSQAYPHVLTIHPSHDAKADGQIPSREVGESQAALFAVQAYGRDQAFLDTIQGSLYTESDWEQIVLLFLDTNHAILLKRVAARELLSLLVNNSKLAEPVRETAYNLLASHMNEYGTLASITYDKRLPATVKHLLKNYAPYPGWGPQANYSKLYELLKTKGQDIGNTFELLRQYDNRTLSFVDRNTVRFLPRYQPIIHNRYRFYPKTSSFLSENGNRIILDIAQACSEGDMLTAHQLLEEEHCPSLKKMYKHILTLCKEQNCNNYGILRQYAAAAAWDKLPLSAKQRIGQDPVAQSLWNKKLADREKALGPKQTPKPPVQVQATMTADNIIHDPPSHDTQDQQRIQRGVAIAKAAETAFIGKSVNGTQFHALHSYEETFISQKLNECYQLLSHGNQLTDTQHNRVSELIGLLNDAHLDRAILQEFFDRQHRAIDRTLRDFKHAIIAGDQGAFLHATEHLLTVAKQYNNAGLIAESLNATDACWLFLDAAESTNGAIFKQNVVTSFNRMTEYYQSLPRPLRTAISEAARHDALLSQVPNISEHFGIKRGIGRGLIGGGTEFVFETIHAIRHPIESIQHTILTLGHVCACLDHYILQDTVLRTIRNSPLVAGPEAIGHIPDEVRLDLGLPVASQRKPSELALLLDQELKERQQWGSLWDLCEEKYGQFAQWRAETPPEDKAEQVTAFIFKGLLNVGLSQVMGAGITKAGGAAAQAVRATNASNLAMTAEGTVIAQGVAGAETVADALANAGIVTGRGTKLARPAQLLSQQSSDHQPRGGSEQPPSGDAQEKAKLGAVGPGKTYDTVEELIEAGGPYERRKKGVRLGNMEGKVDEIISRLAEMYGCKVKINKKGNLEFITDKFRVGMHYSASDNGKPTIDVTLFTNKKTFKIRCTQ